MSYSFQKFEYKLITFHAKNDLELTQFDYFQKFQKEKFYNHSQILFGLLKVSKFISNNLLET